MDSPYTKECTKLARVAFWGRGLRGGKARDNWEWQEDNSKNWLLCNVLERISLKRVQTWDTNLADAITSGANA